MVECSAEFSQNLSQNLSNICRSNICGRNWGQKWCKPAGFGNLRVLAEQPTRLHLQFTWSESSLFFTWNCGLLRHRWNMGSYQRSNVYIPFHRCHHHVHALCHSYASIQVCKDFLVWIFLSLHTQWHCGLGRAHYQCPTLDWFVLSFCPIYDDDWQSL